MELEHLGKFGRLAAFAGYAIGRTALAGEYAKYKNRPTDFTIMVSSARRRLEVSRGKLAMTNDPSRPTAASSPERKPLTPAAQRALAEAEARRQAAEANARPAPRESGGPKGPEPTRYGDWENKGIASDF
jgi:hypothetical protein